MTRVNFRRVLFVVGLGVTQVVGFGTSLYLLGVLARPMQSDAGWSLAWTSGGMTIGLCVGALLAPWIGKTIAAGRGRLTLITSSVLFFAGLSIIGLAPVLPVYLLGWMLVGAAMASGLYDALFSELGFRLGGEARKLFAPIAIIGGFASTIFWPLGGWLVDEIGWRGTCLAFASMHIFINLPILVFTLDPRRSSAEAVEEKRRSPLQGEMTVPRSDLLLVTVIFATEALVASIVGVHIINLLLMLEMTSGAAIALAATIGPAQVAGRVLEMTLGGKLRPETAILVALISIAAGLVLIVLNPDLAILAFVLYGAGIGVLSIARASLPLSVFGADLYPVAMGLIARIVTLVQAGAPVIGAALIVLIAPERVLFVLAFVILIAMGAVVVLRRTRSAEAPAADR